MCNFCTSNVNNFGCNTCGSTWNGCGTTWNRCGCNTCGATWNRTRCTQGCGLFSTLFNNACGCNLQRNHCCNCVTICGNLGSVFGANGTTTTSGDAYYARQYGLTGRGCNPCQSAYSTLYGND